MISTFLVLALIGSAVVIYIRLFHFSDPFQYYRLKIWKYSLQGILQDPYLGIGLNMLPYRAGQFNFPADQEVGRYSRIATTADNQYLQILIETGFVGLFLFLIGWISLYFGLRKLRPMFLAFQGAYIVITIISFFTLPLTITSILFLFIFLILFAFPFEPEVKQRSLSFNRIVQLLLTVFIIALFLFAVYFLIERIWKRVLIAKVVMQKKLKSICVRQYALIHTNLIFDLMLFVELLTLILH